MLPLETVPNFSEGAEPRDDRRDRRRAADARAAARRPRRRRPQPLRLHARRLRGRARRRRCSRGSRARASASTCAAHDGAHPRIGAADVVPLVPIAAGGHEPGPRGRARARARGSAGELGLPVFLYGELAPGRGPAFFRRGGPAELQRRIDAGELRARLRAARGSTRPPAACIVGARRPLIAFNVNLRGDPRGGARDRGASCARRAAASPACARSGSTCRGRASSR